MNEQFLHKSKKIKVPNQASLVINSIMDLLDPDESVKITYKSDDSYILEFSDVQTFDDISFSKGDVERLRMCTFE